MRRRARHARPSRLATRTALYATAATATAGAVGGLTASPASASSVGDRAVSIAAAQAGEPYVYGAAGPSSFDCSGLVQYVYSQVGISLPHNSSAQYSSMAHVPQSQKQPGDVLFVYGSGGISHVGIYAGGNSWWVARHTGTTVTRQTLYTNSYYVGRPSGGSATASSTRTSSSTTTSRVVSSSSSGTLQQGSTGSAVVALQRALHITADGEFGPMTAAAVRAFQRSHGLVADGVVGPLTRAALGGGSSVRSVSASPSSSGALLRLGSHGAAVQALQRALGISADGAFGPQTLGAVRSFQRANGLTVDGVVGSQTWGALRAA